MRRFEDKRVLITGGARGIGQATADRFASEGARVLIADRLADAMEGTASEIGQKHDAQVLTYAMDVSRKADVEGLVAYAVEQFGVIDVLINNAGVAGRVPFLELSEETWDRMININLKGCFLVAQAVAREMVKAKSGVIVNMSSTNGLVGQVGLAHYNASKGGVLLLTKTMALELAPYGIRVNCLAPGYIATPMSLPVDNDDTRAEYARTRIPPIPLGRVAGAEEVAAVYAFLASDDASFITGESIVIDGGQLAF